MDIWDVLSQKHAISVLVTIYENPGIIQADFLKQNKQGSSVKYQRLKDLTKEGLIEEKSSIKHWNAIEYYTTDEGSRIAEHLLKIKTPSS